MCTFADTMTVRFEEDTVKKPSELLQNEKKIRGNTK